MKIYTNIEYATLSSGVASFEKMYFILGDIVYMTSQCFEDKSRSSTYTSIKHFKEYYLESDARDGGTDLEEIELSEVSYDHINSLIWYIMK